MKSSTYFFHMKTNIRSSRPVLFCKKGIIKNIAKFTGKHLCQSLLIKIKTLAQVLSCKFCGISKNTFPYRTPPVAASGRYCQIFKSALVYPSKTAEQFLLHFQNLNFGSEFFFYVLAENCHKFKSNKNEIINNQFVS